MEIGLQIQGGEMTTDDRKWVEGRFDGLMAEVVNLKIEVAKLSVKSGIWGLMGGSIPVLMILAFMIIKDNG